MVLSFYLLVELLQARLAPCQLPQGGSLWRNGKFFRTAKGPISEGAVCEADWGSSLFIIDRAHQCLDAGHDDIGVGAGTPGDGVIAPDKADVGGSAGGGAFVQTVLGVGL